jgi:hypothetical protein
MTDAKTAELCRALIHCETENEVVKLLTDAGLWDNPDCWRYYGDNELNWSQAGGQQGRADYALNEKVINSIDSVLMQRCLVAGIDPESAAAPSSIRAAVAKFIEAGAPQLKTSGGRVEDWPITFRRQVAENISVFATEPANSTSRVKPCVNIADRGEGHTPEAFPVTFVSLGKRNKVGIQFVQGKFCQGGSGAIRHCGGHKLQLVVSRRDPQLISSAVVSSSYPKHTTDNQWGFTIVRREKAANNSKMPVLTYLAPLDAKEMPRKGRVLRFTADMMPLLPEGDVPYKKNVASGTLIKLFEYQLKNTGNIIRRDGLLHKLDVLLPEPALPVRLHECRKRAHGKGEAAEQTTTMAGLFSRLKDNDNLEDTPPLDMPITVGGRTLIARVFAFKPGRAATYRDNEGIVFTVNGQTHADLKANFFGRKAVGLQRLAKDLLVVVDCSTLDANERDDLFMSSRDRMSEESPLFSELEKSLEIALRDHPGLRELKMRRAQEEMAEQLKDEKPLESVLKQVLKSSPALIRLFNKGDRLPTPFKPENVQNDPKPVVLHAHPTYFHFSGKESGEVLARQAHLVQRCRITFVTDAENGYFTRKYDPGQFRFERLGNGTTEPVTTFNGPTLAGGRGSVSFDLPDDAKVGDLLVYECTVTDTVMLKTFVNRFELKVAAAQEKPQAKPTSKPKPPGQSSGPNPNGPGGVSFPTVLWLHKSKPTWASHFASDNDCMDIVDDGDGYQFVLSESNRSLETELKASKTGAALMKKKFEVGCVLIGLALIHEHRTNTGKGNGKDGEENLRNQVQQLTRALAPVLLPMVDGLNGLGAEDVVDSDLMGKAA